MTHPVPTAAGDSPAAGSPPDLWGLGDDDAITDPAQDAFGRAPFARHLADVIRTAPEAASFRVGLFGEWGEGKTSVMAMMEHELEGAGGFVCVRVSAWDVRDARDVVRRVAGALAAAAGTDAGVGAKARAAARATGSLGDIRKAAADLHWIGKGLNAVFGDAVERKAGELADWSAYGEIAKAREALGDRRAVVFVDDLDRADAAGLPRVLMALREAVPMEGLVFVLALSARAVRNALERSGYGIESPERFLEKIIEYPAHLPAIPRPALEAYAARRIREVQGLRNPEVLRDMTPLLPSNPRRLKLFLRTLAAFRRTFERFDDDEIDWLEVYLAQLLLVEFPDHARALRADREALSAMSHAWLSGSSARGRAPEGPGPEAAHAPADEPGRARFLAICEVLRRGSFRMTRYELRDVLCLDAAPPAVTHREARLFATALCEAPPGARRGMIAARVGTGTADAPAVARALWCYLLEFRDGAMDGGRLAHLPEERDAAEALAGALTDVAETFVREAGLFRNGLLDAKAWAKLYDQARVWALADDGDVRSALRERERRLAACVLDEAPPALLEGIYRYLQGDRRTPRPDERPPEAYRAAVAAMWARAEAGMVDAVLRRFEQPDGTAVFAYASYRQHGKDLVFDPDSALYRPASLDRLGALAERAAAGDGTVRANFYAVLEQVAYAADGEARDVSPGAAAALLAKDRVLATLWRAGAAARLSDAGAHALADLRGRILRAPGVREDWVPMPAWWPSAVRARAEAEAREAATARGDAESAAERRRALGDAFVEPEAGAEDDACDRDVDQPGDDGDGKLGSSEDATSPPDRTSGGAGPTDAR